MREAVISGWFAKGFEEQGVSAEPKYYMTMRREQMVVTKFEFAQVQSNSEDLVRLTIIPWKNLSNTDENFYK